MAKDGKTEKATPKRIRKARQEGNVARSKELTTFLSLISMAILMLSPLGTWFVHQVKEVFLLAMDLIIQEASIQTYVYTLGIKSAKILGIIIAVGVVLHAINYHIQVGLLFTTKALKPNLQRINPKNYFQNVFSMKTLFEVTKSIVLFLLLGYVSYYVLRQEITTVLNAMLLPWEQALVQLWDVFAHVLKKILYVIFFIAIIDWIYQKWDYEEKLKMAKHEVKDEHKEANGNPEVKRRQRQAMIAMLRNDIINQTPEATFIIVNPTHYSVAIRWDRTKENAPRVVVKGVDQMALLIREIAKEHNIPIVEEPPLARELYRRVEASNMIPEDMYIAVILVIKKLVSKKKITIK